MIAVRSNSESSYRPDSRDTQYTGSSIEVLPTSSRATKNAAAADHNRQALLINNVNFNYENLVRFFLAFSFFFLENSQLWRNFALSYS